MYQYKYPHPAVTVDCVVFGLDNNELKVLLIKRLLEPFKDSWAIPGGFVGIDEDIPDAAKRELREETGVENIYLEEFGSYGKPGRDPRERVITIAYFAIVNLFDHDVKADTDASEAAWFPVSQLPRTAFDHGQILTDALSKLQQKVKRWPLVFEFLPEEFTLRQVQHLYELILGTALDRRNFQKKLHKTGMLIPLERFEQDVSHRAARFYRFDYETWETSKEEGFQVVTNC